MRGKSKVFENILSICLVLSIVLISVNMMNVQNEQVKIKNQYKSVLAQEDEKIQLSNELDSLNQEIEDVIEEHTDEEFRDQVNYVEDEVIFVMSKLCDPINSLSNKQSNMDSYSQSFQDIKDKYGMYNIEVIAEMNGDVIGNKVQKYITYQANINGKVWDIVDKLNTDTRIVCAEPNYKYETQDINNIYDNYEVQGKYDTVPNVLSTPYMSVQWYLDRLSMTANWNKLLQYKKYPGAGVVVAVIDTGVQITHPALKSNIWVNSKEIPNNNKDDDGNGYIDDVYGVNVIDTSRYPLDDNGHGTHVAGIIAMQPTTQSGVGIAYASRVMPIKAADRRGYFTPSRIIKAINYAVKNGADVINMSFGGEDSAALEIALKNAYDKNCILVAAAGNDGVPTIDGASKVTKKADLYDNYPAASKYVIGVMASDEGDKLAGYSNWDYGTSKNGKYDVVAPGSNIYSTFKDGKYIYSSGTSMATAVVSGVAACMRTIRPSKTYYRTSYFYKKLKSTHTLTFYDENGLKHIYRRINSDLEDMTNNSSKIDLDACNIIISNTSYIYNGKAKKPSIRIKYGGKELKEGVHYSLGYYNNVNIGKGKVTIRGINSACGSIDKYFNILPSRVSNFKVDSSGNSFIKLRWDKYIYGTGYEIYRYNANTKKYSLIIRINDNKVVRCNNNNLDSGKFYYYRIRAYKLVNGIRYYGAYSSVRELTSLDKVGVAYSSNSNSSINVKWSTVRGASGYQIYRYDKIINKYRKVKTTSSLVKSYMDNNLNTLTKYYYVVRAYKKDGNMKYYGPFSNKLIASTGPNVPSSFNISKTGKNRALVLWNYVNNVSGYELQISANKSKGYVKLTDIDAKYHKVLLEDIPSTRGYYYRIRAYKKYGTKKVYSRYSKLVFFKVGKV